MGGCHAVYQTMRFGERVRREREARGLSQSALSEAARVKQGTLSRIETRPSKDPALSIAVKIARGLGMSLEALCDDDALTGTAAGDAVAYGEQVEAALSALKRTNLEIIAALSSTLESALLLASNPALARDGFQRAQERLQGLGGE